MEASEYKNVTRDAFALAPLDSRLFDSKSTPLLDKVSFPNHIWQKVIELMSLSRSQKGKKRRGRVSYQLLSINQLGAVYEALLSYRGFITKEDIYEVKAIDSPTPDLLDSTWFVPKSRIGEYETDELVKDKDAYGVEHNRIYPKDRFIYRLAGRDREKSASYYTPQELTQCLVNFTLRERIEGLSADELLKLTICEPAMGSAAFLNEAVNQLAETYLQRKQQELKKRIQHEKYSRELQKVRMYIADRNVYGVDLNPIAVELAEVSLWLNAIYGENQTDASKLPKPAHVPWFGYQLFTGNSLIGARREVYSTNKLISGSDPLWYESEPRRLDPHSPDRKENEVYHFLLPDPGMASYKDNNAKKLYEDDFKRIKEWKKEINKPLKNYEIKRILQLSQKIDELWEEHLSLVREGHQKTQDTIKIWGQTDDSFTESSREVKDKILKKGLFNEDTDYATPYRRLKLVMDYWCSLWFWPIKKSQELPERSNWWLEIGAILEGSIIDIDTQSSFDFKKTNKDLNKTDTNIILYESNKSKQLALEISNESEKVAYLNENNGKLKITKLRKNFPRILITENISNQNLFLHWELNFPNIFFENGGFDFIIGNPPWIKLLWNESGIIGDHYPLFSIRDYSAQVIHNQRNVAFNQISNLEDEWRKELESVEASKIFLNAHQNYRLLEGLQANLYKCFIPLGWKLNNDNGITAYIVDKGLFNEKNAGEFRKIMYNKLIYYFHFLNKNKLFKEVGSAKQFEMYIFGNKNKINFKSYFHIENPKNIHHLEKDNQLIDIDFNKLKLVANFFDQKVGYNQFPLLKSDETLKILEKIGSDPLNENLNKKISIIWDETNDQKKYNTIKEEPSFQSEPIKRIFSAPQIYVGNPLYKTPRSICKEKSDYDVINLNLINPDYFPRTKYIPNISVSDYLKRSPKIDWKDDSYLSFYKLAFRRRLVATNERTLISAILPRKVAHVNTTISIVFEHNLELLNFASNCFTIISDYMLRLTGKTDLYESTITNLPNNKLDNRSYVRALVLNCLTTEYSYLWEDLWEASFKKTTWSNSDYTILSNKFWSSLEKKWDIKYSLRSEFERWYASLELDILVAKSMNLELKDLIYIFNEQFDILKKYEDDTWYDMNGNIVFTSNRGKKNIGLTKDQFKNKSLNQLREDNIFIENYKSFQKVHSMNSGKIIKICNEDIFPQGNREVKVEFKAPFFKVDRISMYEKAWDYF